MKNKYLPYIGEAIIPYNNDDVQVVIVSALLYISVAVHQHILEELFIKHSEHLR